MCYPDSISRPKDLTPSGARQEATWQSSAVSLLWELSLTRKSFRGSLYPMTDRHGVTQARPHCPVSVHCWRAPLASELPSGRLKALVRLHQNPTSSCACICFLPFLPHVLIPRKLSNKFPPESVSQGTLYTTVQRNHLPKLSVLQRLLRSGCLYHKWNGFYFS